MLTRRHFPPSYTVSNPPRRIAPGVVKMQEIDKIPQTWAISRPSMSPEPNGAPSYMNTYPNRSHQENRIVHGGTLGLSLPRNRVEMDPSDVTTWQRAYLFTG